MQKVSLYHRDWVSPRESKPLIVHKSPHWTLTRRLFMHSDEWNFIVVDKLKFSTSSSSSLSCALLNFNSKVIERVLCSMQWSKSLCCILISIHNDCHCYQDHHHHLLRHYRMVNFLSSTTVLNAKERWGIKEEIKIVFWVRKRMAIKFRKENEDLATVSLISEGKFEQMAV